LEVDEFVDCSPLEFNLYLTKVNDWVCVTSSFTQQFANRNYFVTSILKAID
jgi:hypothetical protein